MSAGDMCLDPKLRTPHGVDAPNDPQSSDEASIGASLSSSHVATKIDVPRILPLTDVDACNDNDKRIRNSTSAEHHQNAVPPAAEPQSSLKRHSIADAGAAWPLSLPGAARNDPSLLGSSVVTDRVELFEALVAQAAQVPAERRSQLRNAIVAASSGQSRLHGPLTEIGSSLLTNSANGPRSAPHSSATHHPHFPHHPRHGPPHTTNSSAEHQSHNQSPTDYFGVADSTSHVRHGKPVSRKSNKRRSTAALNTRLSLTDPTKATLLTSALNDGLRAEQDSFARREMQRAEELSVAIMNTRIENARRLASTSRTTSVASATSSSPLDITSSTGSPLEQQQQTGMSPIDDGNSAHSLPRGVPKRYSVGSPRTHEGQRRSIAIALGTSLTTDNSSRSSSPMSTSVPRRPARLSSAFFTEMSTSTDAIGRRGNFESHLRHSFVALPAAHTSNSSSSNSNSNNDGFEMFGSSTDSIDMKNDMSLTIDTTLRPSAESKVVIDSGEPAQEPLSVVYSQGDRRQVLLSDLVGNQIVPILDASPQDDKRNSLATSPRSTATSQLPATTRKTSSVTDGSKSPPAFSTSSSSISSSSMSVSPNKSSRSRNSIKLWTRLTRSNKQSKRQLREYNKQMESYIRAGGDPTKFDSTIIEPLGRLKEDDHSIIEQQKDEDSVLHTGINSKNVVATSEEFSQQVIDINTGSSAENMNSVKGVFEMDGETDEQDQRPLHMKTESELVLEKSIREFNNIKRQSQRMAMEANDSYKKQSFVFDNSVQSALSALESRARVASNPADFELFKKYLMDRGGIDLVLSRPFPNHHVANKKLDVTLDNEMKHQSRSTSIIMMHQSPSSSKMENEILTSTRKSFSLTSTNSSMGIGSGSGIGGGVGGCVSNANPNSRGSVIIDQQAPMMLMTSSHSTALSNITSSDLILTNNSDYGIYGLKNGELNTSQNEDVDSVFVRGEGDRDSDQSTIIASSEAATTGIAAVAAVAAAVVAAATVTTPSPVRPVTIATSTDAVGQVCDDISVANDTNLGMTNMNEDNASIPHEEGNKSHIISEPCYDDQHSPSQEPMQQEQSLNEPKQKQNKIKEEEMEEVIEVDVCGMPEVALAAEEQDHSRGIVPSRRTTVMTSGVPLRTLEVHEGTVAEEKEMNVKKKRNETHGAPQRVSRLRRLLTRLGLGGRDTRKTR